jgi:UDP-N-acetyl-2-amino-2-deoxyglucuronate dehydrogenase
MTLTCAVVGGGDASSAHLSALAKHPDVDLCAVCDADESRAGDRASTYDIRAYGDFEGMLALESLDWIHLCTPTGVHFEQARMALEDDLAIHVESPLTDRAANAEELARLVEGRGGSVSVTSDGVFTPTIQRVATLIEEGAVGTVRAIDIQHTGVAWPHEIGDRDWLGRLDGGAFEAGLASPISQVAYLGGHPSSPSAITANSSRHGTS